MDEKNPQGLALGFRRARAKSIKIKELGITPDFTEEETDELIEVLAKAKAEKLQEDWKKHIKGQRWYVEDLVKFASLEAKERLEVEYDQAFPEVADEDEMLAELQELV